MFVINKLSFDLLLSGCFVEACDPDKLAEATNVTQICTLNKNVIDIRNKTEDLMKCFNTSDNKVGNNCVDCLKEFNLIANKYKQLGDSPNGICFDVVDQVINNNGFIIGFHRFIHNIPPLPTV